MFACSTYLRGSLFSGGDSNATMRMMRMTMIYHVDQDHKDDKKKDDNDNEEDNDEHVDQDRKDDFKCSGLFFG